MYKAKCINQDYFDKPTGDKIPKWMKYVIGLTAIIFIIGLLIGPMFLFSSFNFLGNLNPVSRANIQFNLDITSS